MKMMGIILLMVILSMGGAKAQLIKVEQEVYGMDCAPCAYGLERGLKKIEGLENIKVSLNDGKAYLGLKLKNNTALKEIQQIVKRNGFSARNAEVIIKGEVQRKENGWEIKTNKEIFLVDSDTRSDLLNRLKPGQMKLKGLVKDKEDKRLSNYWRIQVIEIL